VNSENNTFINLSGFKSTKIRAVFDTPNMSTDFGALLLNEVEKECNIITPFCESLKDSRDSFRTLHTQEDMVRQRVYQICLGYEDANDCDTLKSDSSIKCAVGKHPTDSDLSSQPTMSRLENSVDCVDLRKSGEALMDSFASLFAKPPRSIIIDVDPTSSHCYGDQQLSIFNKYEDAYCLMPFHVYDGITGRLITTLVRPGKTPSAKEIIDLLNWVVTNLKKHFPKTMLLFRADGHHSKPAVHNYCDDNGVEFIIGQPKNKVLDRQFSFIKERARKIFDETKQPLMIFASGFYAAQTWKNHQRIVCRVIINAKGDIDTRYVVTSFKHAKASYLYKTVYCDRANAELFIKEHKRGLLSDRTSCNKATANQFRLSLHSIAYMIMHRLRERLLKGTELARAQFDTIRLKLLKVAAHIKVQKTVVTFHLPEHFPMRHIYNLVEERLLNIKMNT
jgi:hypothetical protein